MGSRFRGNDDWGSPLRGTEGRERDRGEGMGSRFRGNDDWGSPLRGTEGRERGEGDGFPLPRERRLGSRPYVGHGTASAPPLWIPAP